MFVKVCGITTVADARAAVQAGVDAIGLNRYPKSPRYVSVELAREIAAAVRGEALVAVLWVNEEPARMLEEACEIGAEVLQLHGSSTEATIVAPQVDIWRAYPARERRQVEAIDPRGAQAILLDTPSTLHGGSGKTFAWDLAAGLTFPVLLAGGLGPDNVAAAIRAAHPWGVDACSRLESSPGVKDAELMRAFVAAAKAAIPADSSADRR